MTLLVCLAASGCGEPPVAAQQKSAPAKVANGGVKEADLATITLSEEAGKRLGIETVMVQDKPLPAHRTWAGEVAVVPGQSLLITAPIPGRVASAQPSLPAPGSRVKRGAILLYMTPFLPAERDVRVSVEAEIASARENADAARARLRRVLDEGRPPQVVEAAQKELAAAEAAAAGARDKLQRMNQQPPNAGLPVSVPQDGVIKAVHVADGQGILSGAPLFEVEQLDRVWIRVPIYVGDLASVDTRGRASISPLNAAGASGRDAEPADLPPSGDPLASTRDLYYTLPNPDLALRPGQKVSATLPMRTEARGLLIPASAVVFDIHGGAWVYENTAPLQFTRRRIEAGRTAAGRIVVTRGLLAGQRIVTAGAAELFGTEFGAGK